MKPFSIFKLCEGVKGRKYRGTEQDFENLKFSGYYYTLSKYMYDNVGKYSKYHVKFIKKCSDIYGSRFNEFDLMTYEYMDSFKKWIEENEDYDAYKKSVIKSIQFVYEFCKYKNIKKLSTYKRTWGVTHIVSGKLNDSVAVILKVQDLKLSRPEKRLLKKSFLSKVDEVEKRLNRDKKLKKIVVDQLNIIRQRLIDMK